MMENKRRTQFIPEATKHSGSRKEEKKPSPAGEHELMIAIVRRLYRAVVLSAIRLSSNHTLE